MSTLNYTVGSEDAFEGYSPIPEGHYAAMIVDSEVKDTAAGDGSYLKLIFTVIDGDYKDRVIYDNINLVNKNKTAERTGKARLESIAQAVGMSPGEELTDSAQLHDVPMSIKVGIRPARDGYDAQNTIKAYSPYAGLDGGDSDTDDAAADSVMPWQS
jgi:hypothetical protein